MILIADLHNKSSDRLHMSHLTGEKNECCMAVLTDNNSEKLM